MNHHALLKEVLSVSCKNFTLDVSPHAGADLFIDLVFFHRFDRFYFEQSQMVLLVIDTVTYFVMD